MNQLSLQAQSGEGAPAPVHVRPGVTTPIVGPAAEPMQGLIVGGENAAVGELPWQVLVRPGPYLCGGSLIATQWVVTI
ncbi:MAG: trypsin-like serine protease [Caldilinea sp.]